MESFYLADDENFDKTCGEIIFTTKGRLAYYCTLCGGYKHYQAFVAHLLDCSKNILDDDLKECITEASLFNSTGAPFPTIFQEKKSLSSSALQVTEIKNRKTFQVTENLNTESNSTNINNFPKYLQVKIINKSNNTNPVQIHSPPQSSKFESLEVLDETVSKNTKSCNNYLTTNVSKNLENEEFLDTDSGDSDAYYKEDGYEIIHEENEFQSRLEDNESESKHIEIKEQHSHRKKTTQVEFEKQNCDRKQITHIKQNPKEIQKQQENNSKIKRLKRPLPIEIPNIVRDVKRFQQYFPSGIKDEERKFECPVCGLAFKDNGNMKHHLIRHTDQRNYSCPHCEKRFFSSSEVKIHLRSHGTEEKKFLCTECGLAFDTRYKLNSHQKRHTQQKDYICEICEKGFYSLNLLKGHMYSHSTERKFSCEICGAQFKRKNGYREHKKMHENKRNYKCKICDASFNIYAGLYSHMKSKHKDVALSKE